MNWNAALSFSTTTLFISVFCSSVSIGSELIYDNFNDAATDNNIGVRFSWVQGPGTIDASSGDLVMNEQENVFSMWQLRGPNGERIDQRSEMSLRVRMTVDEILGSEIFFAGVGTIVYNHVGIVDQQNEVRLRTGTGCCGDVDFLEMPYDVEGEQLFLQLDMFDGMLSSYAWVPGKRDSMVEVNHTYQPVITTPSIGIRNGSATIHELLVSDTQRVRGDFVDGDYNANGIIDAGDTQLLIAAFGSTDFYYDRSEDNLVNSNDLADWVHNAANTWLGDSNLDGEFSSKDFVDVFQAGKYEIGLDAGWSEGDWNGDGNFSSGDFVAAFEDGGYELGPKNAIQSVPEPSSILLFATGIVFLIRRRR